MTEALKELLTKLKDTAPLKEYHSPVPPMVEHDGYNYTYCLEKTIINVQPTLAISRVDRGPLIRLPQEISQAIREVFGSEILTHQKVFPFRGDTRMFVW